MLLLSVLEDAFRAEHLLVGVTVKLHLFAGMGRAVLDASDLNWCLRVGLLISLHG